MCCVLSVTVVGFGMKQRRYEDVHRAALRWPASAFRYIGIDNENETDVDYDGEVRSSPSLPRAAS